MSDLLNEMISIIGIEYFSGNYIEYNEDEKQIDGEERNKIFPDFDHVTVI